MASSSAGIWCGQVLGLHELLRSWPDMPVAAESMLRDRAHAVWLAHGLPPFTITFVEAAEG